ncbi:MAG: hypothetical protein ABIR91_05650, partial [Candidatus Saccharimonadales bacterium]
MNERMPDDRNYDENSVEGQWYDVMAQPEWRSTVSDVQDIQANLAIYENEDIDERRYDIICKELTDAVGAELIVCASVVSGAAYMGVEHDAKQDERTALNNETLRYIGPDIIRRDGKWIAALQFTRDSDSERGLCGDVYHVPLLFDSDYLDGITRFDVSTWDESENRAINSADAVDMVQQNGASDHECADTLTDEFFALAPAQQHDILRQREELSSESIRDLIDVPAVSVACRRYYIEHHSMPGFALYNFTDLSDIDADMLPRIEGRVFGARFP